MTSLSNVALFIVYVYLFFVCCFIIVAATNKTVGVRYLYIRILRKIFFWLKRSVASEQQNAKLLTQRTRGRFSVCSWSEGASEFQFSDICSFIREGVSTIVDDEVTRCFDAAQLPAWNLLTRTNVNYQFVSYEITVLWSLGFIVRYLILFPLRFILFITGIVLLILSTAFLGLLKDGRVKRYLYRVSTLTCFRILARSICVVVSFHNKENRATSPGICVANHTSPIDVLVLAIDNCYALVGQSQPGILNLIQSALNRATRHIWFERSEIRDRSAVGQRLKEHVADSNNLPVLIFPEGTCLNNTSVMMFKKGSFETGATVYPVAIKYDPSFGDPFWNSSRQSMFKHILLMMSSWAIVCDVWYMPAENIRSDESSVDFANRVKKNIAARGGLVDLDWDGGLKRSTPKPTMKAREQERFSNVIKQRQHAVK